MGNCSSSSFFSLPKRYLSSQLCKHFSLSLSFFPPYDMILLRLLIGTQHCRGSKLLKLNNGMVSVDDEGGTHEGIKTIPVQRACEFTTNSVLCVCIVTWNMNSKVHTHVYI